MSSVFINFLFILLNKAFNWCRIFLNRLNRMVINMSLGARLKSEREKRNWSQVFVAKKIGITNAVLSNYERDIRDPDTETLKKLANLYGVSIDFLLDNKVDEVEQNKKQAIMDKIANEFPNADLMFKDLANMTAEQLEEVYDFIKFKLQKGSD